MPRTASQSPYYPSASLFSLWPWLLPCLTSTSGNSPGQSPGISSSNSTLSAKWSHAFPLLSHSSNAHIYNFSPDLFSESRGFYLITYLPSLRLAHRHLKFNMFPVEFFISRQWPFIHSTAPESWESFTKPPSLADHSSLSPSLSHHYSIQQPD